MLLLALDTTSSQGSCAIARNGDLLLEAAGDATRTQASRLPGDLQRLLERAGLGLADIDLFVVATGPGSFTGLRVGIATMQGLAFARHKPLAGVSAFDALAALASRQLSSADQAATRTAIWIDAWRGEVYAAIYQGRQAIDTPTVERPEQVLARLAGRVMFIGDAVESHRALISVTCGDAARFATPAAPLLAGTIALLAYEAARDGALPAPDAITPLYVRRPDAEIARDVRTTQ